MLLRKKVEEYENYENDHKIKYDLAHKDKEELKKKVELQNRENL